MAGAEFVRASVGPRDAHLTGGDVEVQPPATLMHADVVEPAEGQALVHCGATVDGPWEDVVDVEPGSRRVTSGPPAGPVPRQDGLADPGRHDAVGAAHIER